MIQVGVLDFRLGLRGLEFKIQLGLTQNISQTLISLCPLRDGSRYNGGNPRNALPPLRLVIP
jgi:hypothetical protein